METKKECQVKFRLTKELKARLEEYAQAHKITLSETLRTAAERLVYLNK